MSEANHIQWERFLPLLICGESLLRETLSCARTKRFGFVWIACIRHYRSPLFEEDRVPDTDREAAAKGKLASLRPFSPAARAPSRR